MKQRIAIVIISAGLGAWASADPVAPERPGRDERGKPKGGDFFVTMLRGLDKDKDGAISLAEFSAGERVGRLPEEHQKRLFERLDKDHDGHIRRDEIPRGKGGWEGRGRPFDPNADGKVSFEEFIKNPRVAALPEPQQREIFNKMDRNGDGFLSPEDRMGPRPGEEPGRPRDHGFPPLGDLDTDKNGSVSFEEFRNSPRMKDQDEDKQEDAFEKLDRNGNGEIEREEFPQGPRPERKGPGGEPRKKPAGGE